jgi:ribose transport system substrate-binding protein
MSRVRTTFLAICALLAAGLVLAACGSDSDSSSGGDTSAEVTSDETGATGGDSAGIEEAEAKVKQFTTLTGIDWPKPPGPFTPGQGKIAILTDGNAGQESLHNAEEAVEAVNLAGWTPSPIFDGEYNPNVQNQNVRTAVAEGYDAVLLLALPPDTVKAALDEAFEKGVIVACVMCADFDPGAGNEDLFIESTANGAAGEAMGAWIVANSGGDAKILAWIDNAYKIVQNRMAVMETTVGELCPDCEIEFGTNQTTDLSEPGPPFFTAALAANPKGSFDFAIGGYDPLSFQMWQTARQAGRDELRIGGFDGNPPNIAEIAKGELPELATAVEPYSYETWSAVDQIMRLKTGEETWDTASMPFVLITKENVADYPKSGFFEDPAFDFRAMYEEMWGGKG